MPVSIVWDIMLVTTYREQQKKALWATWEFILVICYSPSSLVNDAMHLCNMHCTQFIQSAIKIEVIQFKVSNSAMLLLAANLQRPGSQCQQTSAPVHWSPRHERRRWRCLTRWCCVSAADLRRPSSACRTPQTAGSPVNHTHTNVVLTTIFHVARSIIFFFKKLFGIIGTGYTGHMPFRSSIQQYQSAEGNSKQLPPTKENHPLASSLEPSTDSWGTGHHATLRPAVSCQYSSLISCSNQNAVWTTNTTFMFSYESDAHKIKISQQWRTNGTKQWEWQGRLGEMVLKRTDKI